MRTFATGLVCILLAGLALGQANSEPVLKPRVNAPVQDLPSPSGEATVAPNAAVITIQGVCEKPASGADCKTVITRAEFERAVNAVRPNMSKQQEKQFANQYVAALILAQRAHELGLDSGPQFDEQMYLQRLQLLARLAGEQMQKEAGNIPEADIEAYYKEHTGDFKTISYDKLYVPKTKESDVAGLKPNDPEAQKKREASEAAMKEVANKLRQRAAAGEDFTKLQQEAYTASGEKMTAGNTHVDNITEARFYPRTDVSIFQLKPGTVSEVFDDPQAYMIYKVDSVQDQPLAAVHDQIKGILQGKKLQEASQGLQKTATEKTTYDDAYFAVPAPPSLRKPGEEPAPAPAPTQTPGKK